MTKDHLKNKYNKEDQIEITYYTDPLCCWSWSMEPQWKRLRFEFEGQIRYKYCMGGLLPDWNTFADPMNSISRPVQMGPLWFEAKHISGQPIDEKIWVNNPPKSSYPACIAFKCIEKRSDVAADLYLRMLREAVMLRSVNISNYENLIELANDLSDKYPMLIDIDLFISDLKNSGVELLKADLAKARFDKVGRFPSFIIKNSNGSGVMIVGYRPYDIFIQAIRQVAPNILPSRTLDVEEYDSYWAMNTEREIRELEVKVY